MKKIIFFLSFFAFSTFGMAQSAKYAEAMKKTIAQLDADSSAEQFQQSANAFERIASAEKSEWLPAYYAAYALIMKAFELKDVGALDALGNKADEMIAMGEAISPKNSELSVLKAMVLQARMRVDGSRGMSMGPKATMILQEALGQQPLNNPRAQMQMAQMKYYTPAAFGGGKEAGISLLKKSISTFAENNPKDALSPHWGEQYAARLLANWEKQ